MNDFNQSTEGPAQSNTAAEEPRFSSFYQAFESGRKDASSIAREAAPKLKQALAGAAHDVAYGAAFGACFAACFAKELLPSSVRETLRRGMRDAKQAAGQAQPKAPASEPFAPVAGDLPPPLGA